MVQLESMARVAPAIFLGVAAFLLHIVISRLIATEREQIGLLKAFGYSGLAVGWHYTKFVLAIVGIGIFLGFVGGAWLGRGLTEMYTDFFITGSILARSWLRRLSVSWWRWPARWARCAAPRNCRRPSPCSRRRRRSTAGPSPNAWA
jgi:ABC-type antimicrobial peptide transport system permease subunit